MACKKLMWKGFLMIEVGDLVTAKGGDGQRIGLVCKVSLLSNPIDRQIVFIDQQTGKRGWEWQSRLIKLNKPAEGKS